MSSRQACQVAPPEHLFIMSFFPLSWVLYDSCQGAFVLREPWHRMASCTVCPHVIHGSLQKDAACSSCSWHEIGVTQIASGFTPRDLEDKKVLSILPGEWGLKFAYSQVLGQSWVRYMLHKNEVLSRSKTLQMFGKSSKKIKHKLNNSHRRDNINTQKLWDSQKRCLKVQLTSNRFFFLALHKDNPLPKVQSPEEKTTG